MLQFGKKAQWKWRKNFPQGTVEVQKYCITRNTYLTEKKQRRPELIFFFPNNLPANMWRKREGQSRGITSHVLAWGTTGTVDFCGGGRGIGDFRKKIVPPDWNSWRIILEKFLHRCISADKRKNYIARGLRKKIRTQTKSPILPTPLKSQMVGFEKTCAWKGLFSSLRSRRRKG